MAYPSFIRRKTKEGIILENFFWILISLIKPWFHFRILCLELPWVALVDALFVSIKHALPAPRGCCTLTTLNMWHQDFNIIFKRRDFSSDCIFSFCAIKCSEQIYFQLCTVLKFVIQSLNSIAVINVCVAPEGVRPVLHIDIILWDHNEYYSRYAEQ